MYTEVDLPRIPPSQDHQGATLQGSVLPSCGIAPHPGRGPSLGITADHPAGKTVVSQVGPTRTLTDHTTQARTLIFLEGVDILMDLHVEAGQIV